MYQFVQSSYVINEMVWGSHMNLMVSVSFSRELSHFKHITTLFYRPISKGDFLSDAMYWF